MVLGESGGRDVHSDLDKDLPVTGFAMLGEDPDRFIFKFGGLLRNVKVLEEAAAGRGLFTIVPERDGIVRRVPMIMDAQNVRMPSLSFEILRILGGSGTIMIKADKSGIDSVILQGLRLQVPTDNLARFWIHYARNDPSIYVSAVDVLDGKRAAGQDREEAGADRHLRHRHERHQDHAGLARDAGRRDPRPGAGKRADRRVAVAAGPCHGLRIPRRADRGPAGDRLCAEPRAGRRWSASARCSRPRWSAPPGISTSTTAC